MTPFFKPGSLAECLRLLREEAAARPRPLAGGTDLMLELRNPARARDVGAIVDIWQLDELRGIGDEAGALRVGALTTFGELVVHPSVRRHAALLAAVSREIGGIQIQNRGTIGGNIATGSPAGDSLPILLAHDASIVLRSHGGERRVRVREFFTGYRSNVMQPDELIVAVLIPYDPEVNFSYYRKVATRRAQAISKVLIAVRGVRRQDGSFASIAVGVGSVAPTPVRAPHAEMFITAHRGGWDAAALDALDAQLRRDIHPIDDLRSTARYRHTVTFNLLRRILAGGK